MIEDFKILIEQINGFKINTLWTALKLKKLF